jgi:nucleotide-binding universal stress UspA family protein
MSTLVIVSYDGTPNDDDALALARVFRAAGASLELAYVRHSPEGDRQRERLAQHDAEQRLEHGAQWLDDPALPKHVVLSGSTGEGLGLLAERQGAAMIVFGSDYRTPPGRVKPGTSAQRLLEGGSVAIAVAPAGARMNPDLAINSIAVLAPDGDGAAPATAQTLATKLGAQIIDPGGDADLIVVGSQTTRPAGRIALSGVTRSQLDDARGVALVVPHGKPLEF